MSTRNTQRVGRRRRVLVDEARHEEQIADTPRIYRGDSGAPACRYNSQALQSLNAPIAKYIPLRSYSLVLWLLVGFVPIMGLLTLHEWHAPLTERLGVDATRAFELTADGNLVAWLSSVSFGLATVVMLGIYSVRRHRRDDYRGHFTVWRWGIFAAILASIDATTNLHDTWQASCQYVTRMALWGDGSIWWVGLWTLCFGGIMLRLMFEMAGSRPAILATIFAGTCYAWSGLVELGALPNASEGFVETSKFAAFMTGHHMILFALVSYARQVVLEAMGITKASVKKNNHEKREPTETKVRPNEAAEAGQPAVVAGGGDVPPTASQSGMLAKLRTEEPKLNIALSSVDDDEDSETRRLSKAERRRLRKEQRRKAA